MSECYHKHIEEGWLILIRKGYLTLLCHECSSPGAGVVPACWDTQRACWYCEGCDIDATPLVDFIAMLYPATQLRIGNRL